MRRLVILSSLFSLAAASLAAAAADLDSPDAVVVTATRIPTPESQVANSVTVVTAADIAALQTPTLPDVLKLVPGLNVVQTGGAGGQTSLFMRGTNSNHVKVFVDGIDVSDPSNANASFDPSQFLTADIEKIEVLRGPQSGLYGSDAIGGVINVITKSGNGPAQMSASLEGGSFGTFNQMMGVSGSTGGFHYSANLEHFHSGETPVTPPEDLTNGTQRIDDYYDNLSFSTKLGYDFSEALDVGLVARYTDAHLRFTGDDFNDFPTPGFPDATQSTQETTQYYTRLSAHNVAFEGLLDHTFGIAYSNIRTSALSPDNGPSESGGNRVKADWQGNIRLAAQEHLILGAEHQKDAISQPLSADINIDSGYAELQSGFGESFFDTVALRYDVNDHFGSKVTYRIAPVYLIKDSGTKIKGSVGTGFKAPTLEDLFQSMPQFFFFANPSLRPETSTGYDVGFEQALYADKLQFGATYFRNNFKNLITDSADFTTLVNVGQAHSDGVESFIAFQPIGAYNARLDYTYTEAFDDIANLELLRRPKHKITVRNSWHATEQLSFDATILYTGSWVDGNRNFTVSRLDAPSFTTVNLAGNYDVNKWWSVYARINNLFDRRYQDPIGFLQPSIGAFAGVKVKF